MDVRSVPIRNGKAPNFPFTGSHVAPVKKERPNSFMDGREFKTRVRRIEETRRIINTPRERRKALKNLSPLFTLSLRDLL